MSYARNITEMLGLHSSFILSSVVRQVHIASSKASSPQSVI